MINSFAFEKTDLIYTKYKLTIKYISKNFLHLLLLVEQYVKAVKKLKRNQQVKKL